MKLKNRPLLISTIIFVIALLSLSLMVFHEEDRSTTKQKKLRPNRDTRPQPVNRSAQTSGLQKEGKEVVDTKKTFEEKFPDVPLGEELLEALWKRGYALNPISPSLGMDWDYSYKASKQFRDLPILKLRFNYPDMVKGNVNYAIYDGPKYESYEVIAPYSSHVSSTPRGFMFAIADAKLVDKYGTKMMNNIKIGDRLHFSGIQVETPEGKKHFQFSKENAHSWIQLPQEMEGGRVYEASLDILEAAAEEEKIQAIQRKKEAEKWVVVDADIDSAQQCVADMSLNSRLLYFYWNGSEGDHRTARNTRIQVPKRAVGAPFSLLEEGEGTNSSQWLPLAYFKKLPGRNVKVSKDADWFHDGTPRTSCLLRIPKKHFPDEGECGVLISATKPDSRNRCALVYVHGFSASEIAEVQSVEAKLFPGDFWVIVSAVGTLREYCIAPLHVEEGKTRQTITLREMKRQAL